VSDALLLEVTHDERKRGNVALRISLDDRYRGILEETRILESAKETRACIIERCRRRYLRVPDDSFWAILFFAARESCCERNKGC